MLVRWHGLEAEALGIAVWLLYAMDRVLDASVNGVGILQERHRFHLRYRRTFLTVGAVLLPVLLWRVVHLSVSVRATWLALGLPMAAYALAVHVFRLRRVPKEVSVAVMFALATALPALRTVAAGQRAGFGMSGLLFAGVCWLNCTAINKWESADCSAGLAAWRWLLGFGLLCAGCVVVLLLHAPVLLSFACALSACLLCVLDRVRRRLDATGLRALADAALLTPLVLVLPALLLSLAG